MDLWNEMELLGLSLDGAEADPSRMVQCPFCRSGAAKLKLREVVGERTLPLKDHLEQTTGPGGAPLKCVGRDRTCTRELGKGPFYACAHCSDMKLCEKCFHAFDHSHHPFIRVVPCDRISEENSMSPLRKMPEVTDPRLGKLLVRMHLHHVIPHILRAHGGRAVRTRCTLCPHSALFSPEDMVEHLRAAHHLHDGDSGPLPQRSQLAPASHSSGEFILAAAPKQKVEICRSARPAAAAESTNESAEAFAAAAPSQQQQQQHLHVGHGPLGGNGFAGFYAPPIFCSGLPGFAPGAANVIPMLNEGVEFDPMFAAQHHHRLQGALA